MSITLLADSVFKLLATVGGADGRCHCLITEACRFSCSVTFTPNYTGASYPERTLLEMQQEREF